MRAPHKIKTILLRQHCPLLPSCPLLDVVSVPLHRQAQHQPKENLLTRLFLAQTKVSTGPSSLDLEPRAPSREPVPRFPSALPCPLFLHRPFLRAVEITIGPSPFPTCLYHLPKQQSPKLPSPSVKSPTHSRNAYSKGTSTWIEKTNRYSLRGDTDA